LPPTLLVPGAVRARVVGLGREPLSCVCVALPGAAPTELYALSLHDALPIFSTFASPNFVTYLGAQESDLRADLQFSDELDTVREDLLASMRTDARLTDVRAFATMLYEARGEEGWETLRVEVGDHASGTVEYLQGTRPEAGQIALSYLNAEKHRLAPGDELTVRDGDGPRALLVSGV